MADKKIASKEWEILTAYEQRLVKADVKANTWLDTLLKNYRGVRLFRGLKTVKDKSGYHFAGAGKYYSSKKITGEFLAEYQEKDGTIKKTVIDADGNYLSGDQPEFTRKKKMGIQEVSRLILLDKSNRLLGSQEVSLLLESTKNTPLGKFIDLFESLMHSKKIFAHFDLKKPTYRVLMARGVRSTSGGYLLDFTFDNKGNFIKSNSKEIADMITAKGKSASYKAASKMLEDLIKSRTLKPLVSKSARAGGQR